MSLSRRLLLSGAIGACLTPTLARARGRVPLGGTLKLRVPWSIGRIDPHNLFDPLAAFFGHAFAEPVYQLDRGGRAYQTLADGWPTIEDGQTVVRLRPGLVSASGRPLGGRDLAWSVKRARQHGASGLMANITPWVRSDPDDPLRVRFGKVAPAVLAQLLASPLLALVPRGFDPQKPDGTGPFKATISEGKLVLQRNLMASRGPSFLRSVEITSAADLSDSLRAFEAGRDQIGWLGLGLHRDRPGARPFDFGSVGWVVLATGKKAGRMSAPGVAQQLANSIPVERLHLGVSRRKSVGSSTIWAEGSVALIFDRGSGQMRAIAEALAVKLSRRDHRVTATGVSGGALRAARATGDFALAVDVVRDPQAGPSSPMIALATADRPSLGREIAKRQPRGRPPDPARATGTLRIGVLGGLGVHGGVDKLTTLRPQRHGRGLDLGASYRANR